MVKCNLILINYSILLILLKKHCDKTREHKDHQSVIWADIDNPSSPAPELIITPIEDITLLTTSQHGYVVVTSVMEDQSSYYAYRVQSIVE